MDNVLIRGTFASKRREHCLVNIVSVEVRAGLKEGARVEFFPTEVLDGVVLSESVTGKIPFWRSFTLALFGFAASIVP